MRKGFKFIPYEEVVTHVYDAISKTIPDQSLGLRDMLMQFAYLDGRKLEEIVNRGYDGDEDDEDILGVDAGALDFAELHDRLIDLQAAVVPIPVEPTPTQEDVVESPQDVVAE